MGVHRCVWMVEKSGRGWAGYCRQFEFHRRQRAARRECSRVRAGRMKPADAFFSQGGCSHGASRGERAEKGASAAQWAAEVVLQPAAEPRGRPYHSNLVLAKLT